MKVLIINGPNLDLLGTREPSIYGNYSLKDLEKFIKDRAAEIGLDTDFFQSNSEGDIVSRIGKNDFDYLIINPAAYTHTSVAIRDAISAVKARAIEVHISNIHARESFRNKSFLSSVCIGEISGLGIFGYICALEFIGQNEKIT